jgi:2-polyprenyl-3-methyl-5-hydroxy-6-metoxy-1,4-benzoquinol methylase
MRAPDPIFADPGLAVFYDALDEDRSDLDAYVAIAAELDARTVLDLGCGTGSLAVRLAALGLSVVGVDPAGAMLEVARSKPLAERVRWIHGDAIDAAEQGVLADLAVMTGNVAQVFVTDSDWRSTLSGVHACLRPRGWFVFETRNGEAQDWESWETTPTTIALHDGTTAVVTRRVTEVSMPLVTFTYEISVGSEVLSSTTTLRFRTPDQIEQDLEDQNFQVADIRDAPDRPGKEFVFLARRRRT